MPSALVAGMPLPSLLAQNPDPGVAAWRERMPPVITEILERWHLTPHRPFEPGGSSSWVAPVTSADRTRRVLKVSYAHDEARDEAAGMRAWQGHGAARLFHAERAGDTSVLLMEQVRPGAPLAQGVPWPQRDEVVAELLRRLWIAPPSGHRFRPLSQMCRGWARSAAQRLMPTPPTRPGRSPGPSAAADELPPELIAHGLHLFRSLAEDWDGEPVLLATDLHHENVLSSGAGEWVIIDPKPYVGDPHYDLLQHMLNDPARLAIDPAAFAARMATLTGLDPVRAQRWLLARCVQEAGELPGAAAAAVRLAEVGIG